MRVDHVIVTTTSMSGKTDNAAKLRAHAARLDLIANQESELDIAEATRQITETLADLYGGRVGEVDVTEDAETITVTLRKAESSFPNEEDFEAETASNAGDYPRDYGEWLETQSREETTTNADGERPEAVAYGEWVDPRGW